MIQSFLGFLGRALLSLIFIFSGLHKLLAWQETESGLHAVLEAWGPLTLEYPQLQHMLSWGAEHVALLLVVAVIFELVGGLLVFLGITVRLGALLLVLFLIPATLLFHHFWNMELPQSQVEMGNFMKNVSILGGLLFVLAWGKGKGSCGKSDKEMKSS